MEHDDSPPPDTDCTDLLPALIAEAERLHAIIATLQAIAGDAEAPPEQTGYMLSEITDTPLQALAVTLQIVWRRTLQAIWCDLLTQMERILEINSLRQETKAVVEAARESLVIG